MRLVGVMPAELEFRHVGGGPKGVFLAVRYVYVVSAAYLIIFEAQRPVAPAHALTIAAALASNVALSFVPPRMLFGAWVAAPLLLADTIWVAWALHTSGAIGSEFFLLYFLVLLLAAIGENLPMVMLGATVASAVNIYAGWDEATWTSSAVLLRVVLLFTAALFYGHVLGRLKSERQRGDRGLEWARTLEAKVAERTAELHGLYEATREASRAKTDFIASMSHELRTPLHIIIGYADMLIDGAATIAAEGSALGSHIRRAATGLLHLVDGVLEIGRLDSGNARIEHRNVSMVDFADELRRREWLSPFPGVTLRWEIDVDVLTRVETDPVKLQVVLTNLVTNALKYTRHGEVVVTVRAHPAVRCIEFRVDDTGPGIAPELLAHIREPFHASSGPDAHRVEGVGLGLAIVYRYAALVGASVRVQSTVGKGTSFVVMLPYAHDRDARTDPHRRAS